jgi:bifunctional hydroxylase/dehydrase
MEDRVVVVGAGPAGLMLACELGLAGVPTVVIERHARPRLESPGIAINATAVELLDQRQLLGLIAGESMDMPLAHFAYLALDCESGRDGHPFSIAVPQATLELRLAEHAAKLGVDIRRAQELAGLEDTGSGVRVHIRSGTGDYSLDARYVAGCDGVDSQVRKLAGIEFPSEDQPFYGITGDVEVYPGEEMMSLLGASITAGGNFMLGPVNADFFLAVAARTAGEEVTRPVLMRIATGEFDVTPADRDQPATVAELRAQVKRIVGRDLPMGAATWLSRWRNVTGHAVQYRSGNVFVAGEAAHVFFPLGGQALGTAMEDAVNLGWKLAAAIRGWAPQSLLDTYHSERHPVGARACATLGAQVALLSPMDRVGPLREILAEMIRFSDLNQYLVQMVAGLDVRYSMAPKGPLSRAGRALVGRRLATFPVTTRDGEQTDSGKLLRRGRGLALDLSGTWAGRIDVVAAKPAPGVDAAALLLRPDGRVAWAGDSQDGLNGLITATTMWFGEQDPHQAG